MTNARDGLLGRLLVLAAALLALLALPVAAPAATVSRTADELRITEDTEVAQTSQVNHLTVTFSGDAFLVTDTSSNPAPVAPCTAVAGSDGRTVSCPATGITKFFVNAGDAADIVHLDSETIPSAVTTSTVQGGPGVDNLFGLRAGADTMSGQADGDNLYGLGGNDTLEGGNGIDALNGDAGDDTLRGGGDEDDLDGGAGTDLVDYSTIEGTANAQGVGAAITGVGVSGAGCQGLPGACEGDIIRLSVENLKGTNQADVLVGSEGANRLEALQGNDALEGRGESDNLLGAQGDDRLDGGTGSDAIDGGDGSDTVDYSQRAKESADDDRANVLVDLRANSGAVNGGVYDSPNATARDTITAVEHASTGGGDDTLIGNSGANNAQGANILNGGAGNDLFRGLGGPDTFIGGPDTDTVSYEDDPNAAGDATDDEGVTADIGGGANDGATFDGPQNGPRDTIGTDVENLRGGNDGDLLIGSAGPNTLEGLGGNDTLRGLFGADVLAGGAGFDTASYSDRTANMHVVASLDGQANDGNADDGEPAARDLVAADVEALTGGSGNDDLTGNSSANVLNGSAGNDTLRGGLGADTFIGGDQEDTVEYHNDGHAAGVTVTIGSGSADDGNPLEADNVQGDVENVTGTDQVDSLTGNEAANKLFGLAGADTLSGQGGDDTLDGGDGAGDVLRGDGNNDLLHGGSTETGAADGADSLDGGTGNDTVTYAAAVNLDVHPYASRERTTTVVVSLDNLANDGAPGENDAVNNVENATGGQGGDTLTGSTGTAGAIANILDGRGGDDTLNPGTEPATPVRDTLIGGDGARDRADYSLRPSTDNLVITLDGEPNDGEPNENDHIFADVEDVSTGAGNDDVTGNVDVVNRIATNAGDDTVRTRDSNADSIDCGPGTDLLIADRRDSFVACEQSQLPPKPLLSVNDPTVVEGTGEGTGTATFTISMDDVVGQDVTVEYATSNGTATAPADYAATSGTAVIRAGSSSTTVTVPIVRDALDEPNETFTLTLSNPNNQADIAEGGGTGTATITDDDAAPTVSVGPASVEEGDSGFTTLNVPVTLSAPSGQAVTVRYSTTGGTATEGVDFTPVTAEQGTVTIPAGQTSGFAVVQVIGDTFDEPNEKFTVTLAPDPTNATLGTASAEQTITDDDDPPAVSIADASVNEGDQGTATLVFDVTLSAPSNQTVTVGYSTSDGTATDADDDYTPATGTVTFAPGTTTATIEVAVTGDTKPELDETLTVTLGGSPQNATIADGTATGTIVDDDAPALTVSSATVTEGNEGTRNATFTVGLNQASARPVTVAYATANGTAESPADFTATQGTLSFAPGETEKTVTVAVAGDALDEDDETFTLELSAPEGATLADATGLGTITDDDASPALTVTDVQAPEGTGDRGGEATFSVGLSVASGRDVTVKYATADGTATAGEDYTAKTGTLTIPAGETAAEVKVPLTGDAADEADETFTLNLSEARNATLAEADREATGTIQDDDEPATTEPARPDISISDVTVAEGDTGTTPAVFTVSLSVPTTATVTMKYLTANGTATGGDYDPASGTLTFNPGERSKTLTVNVRGDKLDESNEAFAMRLTDAVNGRLVKAEGGALITDDDLTRVAPRVSARTSPSRDRRLSYTFTTTGRVIYPESIRRADACAGKVQVRFKAGRKTISTRRVSLDRNCRFTRTVTFGIKSRVQPGRLKVEVRFLGNAFLLPKSAPNRFVRAG